MQKIQCPVLTRKKKPCPIGGELIRNGFCHIHDPNGIFRQQVKQKHRQKPKKKNSNPKQYTTRKTRRRLKNGWKKCEYPDCWQAYNSKWKRTKKGYKYCVQHYRTVRAKKEERFRVAKQKQGFGEFVYLFELGFDRLYKIGKSTDWGRRLTALRGSNPRMKEVAVIGVWSDCGTVEKTMHKRFKEHRKQREIFEFDEEMLVIVVDALMEYGKVVAP